jgi:uncharacterized damage-inducible protein DinB
MPDTDYGSKPTSMADVRTFAQVIGHIADGHYGTCGSLKADSSRPPTVEHDQSLKSKADLVKALAESFAFCDDLLASTTDENALAFVRQGPYEVTRASLLYGLLAHDAEMYGIATVYLRAKGIVPPSTERQGRGRGNR